MWSEEDQHRWDMLRKEARQQEALLNQKIAVLESTVQVREADIDISLVTAANNKEESFPPIPMPSSSFPFPSAVTPALSGGSDLQKGKRAWDAFAGNVGHRHTSEAWESNGVASDPLHTGVSSLPSHAIEKEDRYASHSWKDKRGTGAHSGDHEGREKRTIEEIELDVRKKLDEIYLHLKHFQDTITSLLDLTHFLPQCHANHLVVQRLQSLYADKTDAVRQLEKDFRRRMNEIKLLPSIHRDMKAFEENAEFRYMLEEQHSLRMAHQRVEKCIDAAESAQSMLREQRERFDHAANALVHLLERVPVIKRTLSRVDQGRRREMVVVSLVIVFFLFLMILFW